MLRNKKKTSQLAVKFCEAILKMSGRADDYRIVKSGNIAKNVGPGDGFEGELFNAVAKEVAGHKKTLMSRQRLHVLWQCVLNTRLLPGNVAEVGVFRGGSAYFLARSYEAMGAPPDSFFAIDTFEGHASGTITTADSYHRAGMFADTDYNEVKNYLSRFNFMRVIKGEFGDVAASLDARRYRLAHIDTDLYQPTACCLSFFAEKMAVGGLLIVDDYLGRKCEGVTRAVHEFLKRNSQFRAWFFQTEQIVLEHRSAEIG